MISKCRGPLKRHGDAYLLHGCALVLGKAIGYPVRRRANVSHVLAIEFFGICTHACNGQELLVLANALLQLAKEDAQSCQPVLERRNRTDIEHSPPA